MATVIFESLRCVHIHVHLLVRHGGEIQFAGWSKTGDCLTDSQLYTIKKSTLTVYILYILNTVLFI